MITIEMMNARSRRKVILPDGDYEGQWTAYFVKVPFNDMTYKFEVDLGIRGISECSVQVVNSIAHIRPAR